MAIVITDGAYYIFLNKDGKHRKTNDASQALQYGSINEAIRYMRKAPAKTKGFYVYDTFKNRVLWKHMTQQEIINAKEEKLFQLDVKRYSNGKIKRKTYSQDTRKLIYNNAGGRCELCGRKILFEDMTLDHIKPLSMGGLDEVENLSCVCLDDNTFKSNILPEDFLERITSIFMYQMERKNSQSLKWKIVHKLLSSFTQSK